MFTADDLKYSLSEDAVLRGREYQRQGAVRGADFKDGIVTGLVQGSRAAPYRVSVQVVRGGATGKGSAIFIGRCTCPVGQNCKHVAATLLQVLADQARAVETSPDQPVSDAVTRWLAEVDKAGQGGADEYPPQMRQRLIYLLTITRDWSGIPRFRVALVSVHLLKDGSFSTSQVRPYDPGTPFNGAPAKFLRPTDLAILQRLHLSGLRHGGNGQDGRGLKDDDGAETLVRVLATGRCRWRTLDGPPLSEGPPRPGQIRWNTGVDGRQRPELVVGEGAEIGIVAPPWYVDAAAGFCGPVETGLPDRVAASLLSAPPLAPAEAALARSRLAASLSHGAQPAGILPLPSELAAPRQVAEAPVPHLRLSQRRLQPVPHWSSANRFGAIAAADVPLAQLSFRYGDVEIAAADPRARPLVMSDGALVEVVRAKPAERAAIDRLKRIGFRDLTGLRIWQTPEDSPHASTLSQGEPFEDEQTWLDFLTDELPLLQEAGWQIDMSADFPYRLATAGSDIDAELTQGSGIDWFELHLGVSVDGERVDILPALLGFLRRQPVEALAEFLEDDTDDGDMIHVRLEDGRLLPLPFGRVRPILRALAALFDAEADGNGMIVRPSDAAELADFEASAGVVWRGGEGLRALGKKLRGGVGLPDVALPPGFSGTLRPYQHSGLSWLQLLREVGLGGVLADDMGLGKTVQVLAHLAVEKAAGRLDRPCLVVAPTSLMPNWRAEAAGFTPTLSVLVQHGADRKESFESLGANDLVLTTYALLSRDVDVLKEQKWHMVIADEAQFIKNPATAAAKALRQLDTRHRLALTGTPLENHLGELWALFDFVSPGFLGDGKSFAKNWRMPIEKRGDALRQKALARRVKPFLLRRAKADVAADLPPKTEIMESIALGPAQRALYDGIRLTMHKKLREAIAAKGLRRSRIELLDALLKLRQACCDPRLVKTAMAAGSKSGSAKLERLMEMLPELIEEGRRVLLFSQFTSMLDLIEAGLGGAGIDFVRLTGETRDRATPVRRFQKGEVPLFLISLKAGGTGLNLTAADTVIHYDPWWNPAVEAQATDRAHRIGQDKPVFVHKLVALDTIEVKMAELKARKQALADGLFDPEGGGALDISEADVEFLLGEDR
jgi:superfamily II DNA or RNA helicase